MQPLECMPATELHNLSRVRQQAVRSSEWALLNTMDAQQAVDEAAKRKLERQQEHMQTRKALDSQIQVH